MGVAATVLAPEKLFSTRSWRGVMRLAPAEDTLDGVRIVRPRFMSYSSKFLLPRVSTYKWTLSSFSRAAERGARSTGLQPQFCYSHFLYPAGATTQRLARIFGVSSVVALGEGSFTHYESHFGRDAIGRTLTGFSKIVAESDTLKELCIDGYGVEEERVRVFRTAVPSSFYPRPKMEMRRKLCLPTDRKIVAFVGHFDNNKGPHRVLEAIRDRPDICAVFLGEGNVEIAGPQVLFKGVAPHDEVPLWLSAADMLVQPVLVEASSHSIKEAMACALPVVTSDISTLREYLDSSVVRLVDPTDIGQISRAVQDLADHPEARKALGDEALKRARGFKSQDRARRVLDWIRER